VQEVRHYDAFGRELLGDGTRPTQAARRQLEDWTVEEVTEREAEERREGEGEAKK
jgi:hypothetical protein